MQLVLPQSEIIHAQWWWISVDVMSVTVVRMTVTRQSLNKAYSVSHQNQKKKLLRHKLNNPLCKQTRVHTKKINMRTPCEKNLSKDKERTTGAKKTQNQHYQRVRTVVDSFQKLLLVLRCTGMACVYTPPRPGLPPTSKLGHPSASSDQFWSRIHQEVTINSGRASITESWMNCFVTRNSICVSPA